MTITWDQAVMVASGVSAGVLLLEIVLFIWLARALRTQRRLELRLSHLGDALVLLTEAAENGFHTHAQEIERLAERARLKRSSSKETTGRVVRAARRGRSVEQIAADERVSEGEVRLRMQLNQLAARTGAAAGATT